MRWLALALVIAVASGSILGGVMVEQEELASTPPDPIWPLYDAYVKHFVTSEGRVVDLGAGGHSTSEGQAYGMFFALVANDRPSFDLLLAWANTHLAGGQLGEQLPAWKWGRRDDGEWGIVDPNSASDADLWMAYSLLEAGRLWGEARYSERGLRLLQLVREREIVDLRGFGPMLLPGPEGFQVGEARWRLNPSYMPLQLLERAAQLDPEGPWKAVKKNVVALLRATTPHQLSADWVLYDAEQGFGVDPVTGDVGSYDAIRTYLWAAMLDDEEQYKGIVGTRLSALGRHWREHGRIPPVVKPFSGIILGDKAPIGFFGALLPEVDTWSDPEQSFRIRQQIGFERSGELYGAAPDYYDHNLLLFGLGYADRRFRFELDGRLSVPWGVR